MDMEGFQAITGAGDNNTMGYIPGARVAPQPALLPSPGGKLTEIIFDLETSRLGMTGAGDNTTGCIPEARVAPQSAPFTHAPGGKLTEIVFDLETSGFARTDEILQISAVCESVSFNKYILPTKPIRREAGEVNNLSFVNGVLRHKDKPVAAVSPEIGFKSFVEFICNFPNPVLVGHNIRTFDCPFLFNALQKYPELLQKLNKHVAGYLDTLIMLRKERPGQASYKQVDLVKNLGGKTYVAHDALEDVRSLQYLMQKQAFNPEVKEQYIFTSDFIQESLDHRRKTKQNQDTLKCLITANVITKGMANKIAKSGLQYRHLVLALERNGEMGLESLLTNQNSLGKVRVTSNRRIIDNIMRYFTTLRTNCGKDDQDHLNIPPDPYDKQNWH